MLINNKDNSKKITIKDVASLANVSVSTVSRVLSNENFVKNDKRDRVQKAINELGFIPSVVARQMHGYNERTIGIITTRSSNRTFINPYFTNVIGAIGSVTEENDFFLQINSYDNTTNEVDKIMKLYKSRQVNGFILLSSRVYDPLIVELLKNKVPFTLIGRVIENTIQDYDSIYWVNTDNIGLSKNAVEFLIKKGHEHIGILTGPMQYVVSQDRYTGYRQALVMNGKEFLDGYSIEAGYSYQEAKKAAAELVTNNPEITAIYATDDLKGVAAIEALTEMGISVPGQIAVIGCDNFDISRIIRPALTTVNIPIYDLGIVAANMLIDIMNGNEIQNRHVNLDTELVIRDSV